MFAPWKFKTFLKVTHFIIGTDHRSLEGCLNKSILSFEKVDLRNLVAKISVAADLEIGFAKALKELPSRLVMVVLEWK